MRELVYYVAVSLDGFIAAPDGSFDAFLAEGDHMRVILDEYADALPTAAAQHLGVEQTGRRFGTVLMGANTYAVGLPAMPSPYSHLEQFVLTSRPHDPVDGVTFTSDDPVSLARDLKKQDGSDIWLCGGGLLAGQLLPEINRLVLKRNPVVLGDGIGLFAGASHSPGVFTLARNRDFQSGVSISEFVRAG